MVRTGELNMGMIRTANIEMKEGNSVVATFPVTEADDDWLRARRLKIAAAGGDEEAARELERMKNAVMYVEER